jgi:hypothetical protein
MRQNAKSLTLRDPALAALTGAIAGADFGIDYDSGFGDDFGDDAVAMQMSSKPSAQQLMALWHKKQAEDRATMQRQRALYPNRGSSHKVERYTFSVNDNVVLGTAQAISLSGTPAVTIRPQRVTINAPTVGFARISEIKVANLSATLGGEEDAFNYNANGVGQELDMPTINPSTQASILGTYTGQVPVPFVTATTFRFCGTFKGPASLTA